MTSQPESPVAGREVGAWIKSAQARWNRLHKPTRISFAAFLLLDLAEGRFTPSPAPGVEELVEALRPLAEAAGHIRDDVEDMKVVAVVPGAWHAGVFKQMGAYLTAGHLRAARAALSRYGEGK